jgi:hypothetical protein
MPPYKIYSRPQPEAWDLCTSGARIWGAWIKPLNVQVIYFGRDFNRSHISYKWGASPPLYLDRSVATQGYVRTSTSWVKGYHKHIVGTKYVPWVMQRELAIFFIKAKVSTFVLAIPVTRARKDTHKRLLAYKLMFLWFILQPSQLLIECIAWHDVMKWKGFRRNRS